MSHISLISANSLETDGHVGMEPYCKTFIH